MSKAKIAKYCYKSYAEFQALREKLKGTGQATYFRLGASDVSLVLGLSEWKSVVRTYYEHVDYIPSSFQPNLDVLRGQLLEKHTYENYYRYLNTNDPSLDTFLQNVYGPKKIYQTAKKSNHIWTHPKWDWLFVSPDYLVDDRKGVLEIKNPRGVNASRWENNCDPAFAAQCQFQLFVTEREYAHLCSLEDGTTPRLFTWEYMKEERDRLLDITHDYVLRVLKGKAVVYNPAIPQEEKEQMLGELAPEERNPVPYTAFLRERHNPDSAKATVEGDEFMLTTVVEYLRLKEYEKEALTKENEIREFFDGGIGKITFEGIGSVSWYEKLSVPKSILKKYNEAYG